MGRSVWKGALKLGLVTIPVRMVSSSEPKQKVSFNNLHGKCHGRLKQKQWCPACLTEVDDSGMPGEGKVRGYEYAKNQYLVVEDADLERCEEQMSHSLDITTVVDTPIDPVYIDTTGYLVADGPAAAHAFETVRVSLGTRKMVGTVVLRNRSVRVALDPAPTGFVVYVLRAIEQVRELDQIDTVPPVAPGPQDLALATQLLAAYEGTLDYSTVHDDYTARVRLMLDDKLHGRAPAATAAAPAAAVFSNLTQLLQQSLAAAPKAAAAASTTAPAATPTKLKAVPSPKRKAS